MDDIKKQLELYFEKIKAFLTPKVKEFIKAADIWYNRLPLDKINEQLGGKVDVKSPAFKKFLGTVVAVIAVIIVYQLIGMIATIGYEECVMCGGQGKLRRQNGITCYICNGRKKVPPEVNVHVMVRYRQSQANYTMMLQQLFGLSPYSDSSSSSSSENIRPRNHELYYRRCSICGTQYSLLYSCPTCNAPKYGF